MRVDRIVLELDGASVDLSWKSVFDHGRHRSQKGLPLPNLCGCKVVEAK